MELKKVIDLIKKHKIDIGYLILLFLLPLLAYWKNFDFTSVNQKFFGAEFLGGYYPDFIRSATLFPNFKELLWDPYNMLGLPLLGGVEWVGLFYPVKFLFYVIAKLINPDWWVYLFSYFSVFHISLAGIGMYLFSRKILKFKSSTSFLAGLVYAFNGSLIHFSAFPNHTVGPAYLPFTAYFLSRAISKKNYTSALWAGATLAPILLSGYTPTFIYNNLFVLLFLSLVNIKEKKNWFRIIVSLALANLVAATLSAAALLPNMESAGISDRQQFTLYGSSVNSFYPEHAIFYLFPRFFGLKEGSASIIYGYAGIIPLVLAYISARVKTKKFTHVFLILAVTFFFLSLGFRTFFHDLAYLLIPKYSFFRLTAILQYIVGFCLACLAGLGLSSIEELPYDRFKKVNKELIFAAKTLVVLLIGVFLFKNLYYENEKLVASLGVMLIGTGFFLAGIYTIRQLQKHKQVELLKGFLFFLVIVDLFTNVTQSVNLNSDTDPRILNGSSAVTDWLRENTKDDYSRVLLHELSARYNSAPQKIYQYGGYYGLYPTSWGDLMQPFDKESTDPGWIDPRSKIFDLLNVKYAVTSKKLDLTGEKNVILARTHIMDNTDFQKFMTMPGKFLEPGTEIFIYENLDRLSRAFMVHQVIVAANDKEAASQIKDLDISDKVLVTAPSEKAKLVTLNTEAKTARGDKVAISDFKSYRVTVDTFSPQDGILILSDSYFPSWQVKVDGKKQELLKANVHLRGVYLEKGTHQVVFSYQPNKLYLGIVISLSTAGLLMVLLFLKGRRYFNKLFPQSYSHPQLNLPPGMDNGSEDQNCDIAFIIRPSQFGEFLPFSEMALTAYLKQQGFKAKIINASPWIKKPITAQDSLFEDYLNYVINEITCLKPRFVGMGTFTSDYDFIIQASQRIKECCNIKILIGNVHASVKPDDFIFKDSPVDIVVIGEGELTIEEIIKAPEWDTHFLRNVRGISFYDPINDTTVITEKRDLIQDISILPMPSYQDIDMNYYLQPSKRIIGYAYYVVVPVYTGRGCPFRCRFCASSNVWGQHSVRAVSVDNIIKEIKYLIDQYQVDAVYLLDDTFTVNKTRVLDFCQKIKPINIVWAAQTRVNLINEEMIKAMKDAGCVQLTFGVETGSPKLLKLMQKDITVEQVREAFTLCKKYKMRTFANMMFNLPEEDEEDVRLSCELFREIDPDDFGVGLTVAYPGTEIYEDYFPEKLKKEEYYLLAEARGYGKGRFRLCKHNLDLEELLVDFRMSLKVQRHIFPLFIRILADPNYWKMVIKSKHHNAYLPAIAKDLPVGLMRSGGIISYNIIKLLPTNIRNRFIKLAAQYGKRYGN